jgi:fermentation-respiration switch protein FrsA (DUF1100 family)
MVASVYILLALLLYLFQARMVFLPNMSGRALTFTPGDFGLEYEDVSLTTSDNEQLHGWFIPAPEARGVILFFHGNAGNISGRLDSIGIFNKLGLDTLIIDYRGYGQSTGKPSEKGTYLDAEAAWTYLVHKRGIPPNRVIVFGRSLGAAVAAWLASQHTPGAVILESSFSSGVDMARQFYPYLPAQLITRLRYPVTDYVSNLDCPVLVAHSRQDEIISYAMGQAVYAAAKQPKEFLELRGDHNNGFLITGRDYIAGLESFIGKYLVRHSGNAESRSE